LNTALHLLIQLLLLLSSAIVLGRCAARFKIPRVAGEITAGLLWGPTVLGVIASSLQIWLFASESTASSLRTFLARIALMIFLFVAGLETNLPATRVEGRRVLSVSLLGLIIPFALAWCIAKTVPSLFGVDGLQPWFPLFLGTALAISALPVISRIFIDLKLERSTLATTVLSAAAIDDLVGWGLFVILLNTVRSGAPLSVWNVLLLVGLVFAVWTFRSSVARRISSRIPQWLLLTGFLILMSAVFSAVHALGFHGIFGAFLAGILCGGLRGTAAAQFLRQAALMWFAPLYFVGIGLQIHLGSDFLPVVAGVLFVVACVGKVVGAGAGALLTGLSWRNALAVGCAMNARGAMEIILATIALEHEIISRPLHAGLVFVALATSLMAGPCINALRFQDHEFAKNSKRMGPVSA
jgi:Kef-type K+ transport system membrane component KefB